MHVYCSRAPSVVFHDSRKFSTLYIEVTVVQFAQVWLVLIIKIPNNHIQLYTKACRHSSAAMVAHCVPLCQSEIWKLLRPESFDSPMHRIYTI